jgi:hypothetical protein
MKITLIDSKFAGIGKEFIFNGLTSDCEGCDFKNTCANLEIGRRYRIVAVRNIEHDCIIHESGVMAVEVVEPPIESVVETKKVMGSKIDFEPQNCSQKFCEYYKFCHPLGLKNDDDCVICKVMGVIKCPLDRDLRLVELRRAKQ